MPIVVENNREQLQYQIFKAGELAGFVQYSMSGQEIWLRYTSMKRCFKSAVLVDILMRHVMMDAHASRLAVLPFCPALRTYIAEHTEFAPLVPAEWQDRIPAPFAHHAGVETKSTLDFVRMTGSRRSRVHETTLESPDVADYVSTPPHPDEHPTDLAAHPTGLA
ncbi:GNAT family N-acetyltransferase [Arthrobacter sp.]|uniref:GNAT family N-acetyltransferase n=1 Tax=Arthrobacter sp. TaxID=1667 RepID=UPI003A90A0A1